MNDRPPVSDEEILAVFAATDDRHLRPPDVADELPYATEELRDRIDDLDERGLLVDEDRQSGTAYRLADDALERVDLPDDVVTDVEAQAERVTGTESTTRDLETPASQPDPPQSDTPGVPDEFPTTEIESLDLPGAAGRRDERLAAIRRAYEYLRADGTATPADLKSTVYPEATAGYDDPDSGWFEEAVRPAFERLPEIERDGEEWRFVGEG